MTSTTTSEEPNFFSEGQHSATAKALNEIIVPAFRSVHGNLKEQNFNSGLFSVTIEQKFIEHVAILTIKLKGSVAASLRFQYDPLKGGFKVKETTRSPQQSTITGTTKLTVKSSSATKISHIVEADLTKPILEKTIFGFVDAVVKSNEKASTGSRETRFAGDKSAPILTDEQRKQVREAMVAVHKSIYKDPNNTPTYADIQARRAAEFYKPGMMADLNHILWGEYLLHAATDGVPEARIRTSAKRKASAKRLKKFLRKQPTTVDLKATYPAVTLNEDVCAVLDADLFTLTF